MARSWHDAIAHYAAEGFGPFQTRFARWDALYGLPVRVMDNGRILFEGTARGSTKAASCWSTPPTARTPLP